MMSNQIMSSLYIQGVTVTEVLLSHIVVQYIVLSVQTALMMLVLFVFFDNPMVGSLVWTLSLLFLTGTSGMCYGKQRPVHVQHNVSSGGVCVGGDFYYSPGEGGGRILFVVFLKLPVQLLHIFTGLNFTNLYVFWRYIVPLYVFKLTHFLLLTPLCPFDSFVLAATIYNNIRVRVYYVFISYVIIVCPCDLKDSWWRCSATRTRRPRSWAWAASSRWPCSAA